MDDPSQPTQISGKIVIVTIVVLALGAASFSWWFRVQATDRALALWGADRARLIQRGERVQALRFSSRAAHDDGSVDNEPDGNGPAGEAIMVGGQTLLVTEQKDISAARGLVHLRQALIEDRSFDLSSPSDQEKARVQENSEWAFGLRFTDGRSAVLLLFARGFEQMAVVEDGQVESVISVAKDPTAAGLATFFAEQFQAGQPEEGPSEGGQTP